MNSFQLFGSNRLREKADQGLIKTARFQTFQDDRNTIGLIWVMDAGEMMPQAVIRDEPRFKHRDLARGLDGNQVLGGNRLHYARLFSSEEIEIGDLVNA